MTIWLVFGKKAKSYWNIIKSTFTVSPVFWNFREYLHGVDDSFWDVFASPSINVGNVLIIRSVGNIIQISAGSSILAESAM